MSAGKSKIASVRGLARRASIRFGAAFGAMWILVEVCAFFLKATIADEFRLAGLIAFLATAMTVALLDLVFHLRKQLSKSRTSLDALFEENAALRSSLELAEKQDVTTALVGELQQAFNQKRWEEVIKLGSALSRPLWITGRYQLRIQLGVLVESAASYSQNTSAQASALIDDLGWTKVALGRVNEGKDHIIHGARLARDTQNAYLLCKANRHLSGIAMRLGKLDEADTYLEEAKKQLPHIADPVKQAELEANFLYVDGVLLHKKHNFNEASSRLEAAYKLFMSANDRDRAVKCLGAMGDTYLSAKNISAAKDAYRNGLSLAQQISRKDVELKCLAGLGNTALAEANKSEASQFFEDASKVALQLGNSDKGSELKRRASEMKGTLHV